MKTFISFYIFLSLMIAKQNEYELAKHFNYGELYNEQSLEKSNGFLKNGNVNITDYAGGLTYRYPVFSKKLGLSSSINISLVYNSNVGAISANSLNRQFSAVSYYPHHVAFNTVGGPGHLAKPAIAKVDLGTWVLNVNGVAVQVLNWENRVRTLDQTYNVNYNESDFNTYTAAHSNRQAFTEPFVRGNYVNRIINGWHFNFNVDKAGSKYNGNILILNGNGGIDSYMFPGLKGTFTLGTGSNMFNTKKLLMVHEGGGNDIVFLTASAGAAVYEKLIVEKRNGMRITYKIHYSKYNFDDDDLNRFDRGELTYNHQYFTGYKKHSFLVPEKINFVDGQEIRFVYDTNDNLNRLKPSLKEIQYSNEKMLFTRNFINGTNTDFNSIDLKFPDRTYQVKLLEAVSESREQAKNNIAYISEIEDPEQNKTLFTYSDQNVKYRGLYDSFGSLNMTVRSSSNSSQTLIKMYSLYKRIYARNIEHNLKRLSAVREPGGKRHVFEYVNSDFKMPSESSKIAAIVDPVLRQREYALSQSYYYRMTGREYHHKNIIKRHKIYDMNPANLKTDIHYYYFWYNRNRISLGSGSSNNYPILDRDQLYTAQLVFDHEEAYRDDYFKEINNRYKNQVNGNIQPDTDAEIENQYLNIREVLPFSHKKMMIHRYKYLYLDKKLNINPVNGGFSFYNTKSFKEYETRTYTASELTGKTAYKYNTEVSNSNYYDDAGIKANAYKPGIYLSEKLRTRYKEGKSYSAKILYQKNLQRYEEAGIPRFNYILSEKETDERNKYEKSVTYLSNYYKLNSSDLRSNIDSYWYQHQLKSVVLEKNLLNNDTKKTSYQYYDPASKDIIRLSAGNPFNKSLIDAKRSGNSENYAHGKVIQKIVELNSSGKSHSMIEHYNLYDSAGRLYQTIDSRANLIGLDWNDQATKIRKDYGNGNVQYPLDTVLASAFSPARVRSYFGNLHSDFFADYNKSNSMINRVINSQGIFVKYNYDKLDRVKTIYSGTSPFFNNNGSYYQDPVLRFSYDEENNVLSKEIAAEKGANNLAIGNYLKQEFHYNTFNKIAKIKSFTRYNNSEFIEKNFSYNALGQLSHSRDTKGKFIEPVYNERNEQVGSRAAQNLNSYKQSYGSHSAIEQGTYIPVLNDLIPGYRTFYTTDFRIGKSNEAYSYTDPVTKIKHSGISAHERKILLRIDKLLAGKSNLDSVKLRIFLKKDPGFNSNLNIAFNKNRLDFPTSINVFSPASLLPESGKFSLNTVSTAKSGFVDIDLTKYFKQRFPAKFGLSGNAINGEYPLLFYVDANAAQGKFFRITGLELNFEHSHFKIERKSAYRILSLADLRSAISNRIDPNYMHFKDYFIEEESIDADGKKSYSYKNSAGQLIATKVLATDVTAIGQITMYEYDKDGNLIKIIHPDAHTSSHYIDAKCTKYNYDTLYGTLKSKKLADQGLIEYAYDHFGQVRFSRDAVQKAANEFSFIAYDGHGRTIYSGLYKGADANTKFDARYIADPKDNASVKTAIETENFKLIKTAYDKAPDWSEAAWSAYPASKKLSANTLSYLVGKATYQAWRKDNASSWNFRVFEPDETGKIIRDINIEGNLQVENHYEIDFLGRLHKKENRISYNNAVIKKIYEWYDYHETGKIKSVYRNTRNIKPLYAVAEYDFNQYQEQSKLKLANGLQSVDYRYNFMGWLTAINDPDNLADDKFAMSMHYWSNPLNTGNRNKSGNISAARSVTVGADKTERYRFDYHYDGLNRLKESRSFFKEMGIYQRNFFFDSSYQYDLMGNIKEIIRKGLR